MRWRTGATLASCGLAFCVACGGSGGNTFIIDPGSAFPQGFLPQTFSLASDRGDVAFRSRGDLYVVDGSADVTSISKSDGSATVFSADVGPGAVLRSVTPGNDGAVFVGDDAGLVHAIDRDGVSSVLADTMTGLPITGLVLAPEGFGDLGGSLIAAAGDAGLIQITTGALPVVSDFAVPGERYVDVAFSGRRLYALDATDGEIDTVDTAGTPTSFQGPFANPVGLTVDRGRREVLVADAGAGAGDGILFAVPDSGDTPPIALASYDFDPMPPSGVSYDGLGAIAWVTRGSVVVRGAAVPRADPGNPNFGRVFASPDTGFGDLEFQRDGRFLLVANRTGENPSNFLFRVSRNASSASSIESAIGASDELLLSLAYDPFTQIAYLGSDLGNVFQRSAEGEVTLLAGAVSPDPLLGLELAPGSFGAFGGHLVATTSMGEVFTIDPGNPVPLALTAMPIQNAAGNPARLSDLVFASDGRLFVLDNGASGVAAQVLDVDPDGTFQALAVNPAALGRPEGIEIDEGANRLLIARSSDAGVDQLIEVILGSDAPGDETVGVIANLLLDVGFFPSGVVYDRLGTVIVRQGDQFTSLGAVSVAP